MSKAEETPVDTDTQTAQDEQDETPPVSDDAAQATPEDAPDGAAPIPSMTRDAAADVVPEDAGPGDAPPADPAARIAELETEAAEMKDRALRAMAEAENVRRRAERDKQDASKYAVAAFAREVLGVGANLRRALDSIDADARKASDALESLATGVEMTERALVSALERQGITRIDPLGQRFDSNQHEAMFEVPDESQPAGTVAQVIEVGYMLRDRLLRPAKVGVTKGGPKPAAAPTPDPEPQTAAEGEAQAGGNKAYEQDGAGPGAQVDEKL